MPRDIKERLMDIGILGIVLGFVMGLLGFILAFIYEGVGIVLAIFSAMLVVSGSVLIGVDLIIKSIEEKR